MDSAKRFLKSSAIYFAGNVLTKVISFFLLPIYTARIATGDMGYYDTSVSYLNILVPVICMEIWSGIMRYIFDYKDEEGKYKAVFNGMVIFTASFVLYTLIFVGLGVFSDISYLVFIYFYGLFTMLQNIYSYISRALGYNTVFAVSGIIGSLVNSLSNIVMILCFGMTIDSLYLAMILGFAVQIVIMESRIHLFRKLKLSLYDSAIVKSMVKFSLPLCLNSASFWFLSGYNRVAVTNVLGLEANGLYAAAGKFTYALTLVSICFNMAWQELAYSKGNDDDKSELYSTAANYYIKFLAIGSILFLPAIQLVFPFFIRGDYRDCFGLIPLYILATGVSIFSTFQGNIFGAEKKTGTIFLSTFFAAVCNVACFHLLVGKLGIQAANVALLLGFTVNVIIRNYMLRKAVHIRVDFLFLAGAVIAFAAASWVYMTDNAWLNIGFAVLVCAASLFIFRGLIKKALEIIKKKLKKA